MMSKQLIDSVVSILKKEDNLDIHPDTVGYIASRMTKNGIPVDVESLYLNCIVDSLGRLIQLDAKIRSETKDTRQRERKDLVNKLIAVVQYSWRQHDDSPQEVLPNLTTKDFVDITDAIRTMLED